MYFSIRETTWLKSKVEERVSNPLDITRSNPFSVRAYRNAARRIEGLGQSISDIVKEEEDLSQLPGIGKDLAKKVKEIVETGTLSQLEELESQPREN